ncbi:MAG: TlyA family RNA methyltransferase [SAR202 cluster bacterium]|nr:TlyA family RNA methyltransferase [SAR202 cluster bacterium]
MAPKVGKRRLDVLLHEQGLAESRQRAQALVMAGRVLVDGQKVTKPGTAVAEDARLSVAQGEPYVGRGGHKLAGALDEFGINPEGLVCLDVGASTGGFTDCLLQRGARRVYAVDVGRGQLDYRLRQDPRVVSMEEVNAHHPFELPEKVGLVVIDVSFISLTKVIPNALPHLERPGMVAALVKPQFEAEREEVGKGGIVRDPKVHAKVLGGLVVWSVGQGLRLRGLTTSPITGADGNREFFLWLEQP